ncbi:MAG: hypothetical protein GF393_13045, partial [Armatimonadia bacterium]|nr:hypothetical protein [Armatimonadia bacterium]
MLIGGYIVRLLAVFICLICILIFVSAALSVDDTTPPIIVSTQPSDGTKTNISLTEITVELEDDISGIDFSRTSLILRDPDNTIVAGNISSDNSDTLIFNLNSPLPKDGSKDGVYRFQVLAWDLAGNSSSTYNFSFTYDSLPPSVKRIYKSSSAGKSQNLSSGAFVNENIASVSAELTDITSIDFSSSTIVLRNPDGERVSGEVSNNGNNLLIFTLTVPLPTDGSEDGLYTVQITARDQVGNSYTMPYTLSFIYDSVPPSINIITKNSTDGNVQELVDNAYIKSNIFSISAQLSDDGSDIDTAASRITLHPSGSAVALQGKKLVSGKTITWQLNQPLLEDGSDDGVYQINILAVDGAGNIKELSWELNYDTTPSLLPSITISPPSDQTEVTHNSSINVTGQTEAGALLFSAMRICFIDADGQDTTGELLDVSDSVTINASGSVSGNVDIGIIPENAGYVGLQIVVSDRAGNQSDPALSNLLTVDRTGPILVSTTPADSSNVKALSEINAFLSDAGAGVDLENSIISLTGPTGSVAGEQSAKDDNTLVFKLGSPLPTDGTVDGDYVIQVYPVDKAGNAVTEPYSTTFTYDSVPPVINSVLKTSPTGDTQSLMENVYINTSISSVSAQLSDTGSGIDPLASRITLHVSGSEIAVSGNKLVNENVIAWELDQELAADGSEDGVYQVKVLAVDKAGNTKQIDWDLNYDTTPSLSPSITIAPPVGQTEVTDNDVIVLTGQTEPNAELVYMQRITYTDADGQQPIGELLEVSASARINPSGSISGNIDIGTLPEDAGYVGLVMVVSDQAGNISEPTPSNLLAVDKTPPILV